MHLLDEAKEIPSGSRSNDYGRIFENHQRIAALWSVILEQPITPEQVALCMIGFKLARLIHNPSHYDSLVDAAGYTNCLNEIRLARLATGAAG